MSLLNTLTNNSVVKGVVGGALNALPGYSTLGANISNPNVNYQGQPNNTASQSMAQNMNGSMYYDPNSGQVMEYNNGTWSSISQPAMAVTYSPTSSYSGAQNAQTQNFINQAYDTRRAAFQSTLDTLQPQQDQAELNVSNQYQNQANALNVQKTQGDRNLAIAGQQVRANKVKSLADLARQVQTMGMSYNNQLGTYGAGDSSAVGLINQALSGQASRNRSNVLQDANQQQSAINLQAQDLQTAFNTNMKTLDDWKSQQLNNIATQFLQQRQAIQQQMNSADVDRAQALAQLDTSYTQQAIQRLADLENTYKSQAQDLIGRFRSVTAPNASINSALQQYAVQPINAGQIAAIGAVPTVSAGNEPTQTFVPYLFRDQNDQTVNNFLQ